MVASDPARLSGRLLIDEDFLRERGYTDFERYAREPGHPLTPDLYIDSLER